jgi:hypothetical protein
VVLCEETKFGGYQQNEIKFTQHCWVHSQLGYQIRKKGPKDFLELLSTNNITQNKFK